MSLAQLTGAPDGAADPKPEAVQDLLAQLGRLLTSQPKAGQPDPPPAKQEEENAKDEITEKPLPSPEERVLDLLDGLDDLVREHKQRRMPDLVRDLLDETGHLVNVRFVALKRGVLPPAGLDRTDAMKLLIADALYPGFTRLAEADLDDLADQVAAAANVSRGAPFLGGGEEVLAERRPFFTLPFETEPRTDERRRLLLRQLSEDIWEIYCHIKARHAWSARIPGPELMMRW